MDLHGGCLCRALRYKLTADPLIVHACHCRDCQRVTGGAFVINIWIESRFVESGPVAPKSFMLSGGSGNAHEIFFCESCGTCVWSRYYITRSDSLFVRAGTLDNPEAVKPDIHMFTRSKLPWLDLPKNVPTFEAAYKLKDVWSAEEAGETESQHRGTNLNDGPPARPAGASSSGMGGARKNTVPAAGLR